MPYIDPLLPPGHKPEYFMLAKSNSEYLVKAFESLGTGLKIEIEEDEKDKENIKIRLSIPEGSDFPRDFKKQVSLNSFLTYFSISEKFPRHSSFFSIKIPVEEITQLKNAQEQLKNLLLLLGPELNNASYGGIPFLSSMGGFVKSLSALPPLSVVNFIKEKVAADPKIDLDALIAESPSETIREGLINLKKQLKQLDLSFKFYTGDFYEIVTLFGGSLVQVSFPQDMAVRTQKLKEDEGPGLRMDLAFRQEKVQSASGEPRCRIEIGGRDTWNIHLQQLLHQPFQMLEIICTNMTLLLPLLENGGKVPNKFAMDYLQGVKRLQAVVTLLDSWGISLSEEQKKTLENASSLDEKSHTLLEEYCLNHFQVTALPAECVAKIKTFFSLGDQELSGSFGLTDATQVMAFFTHALRVFVEKNIKENKVPEEWLNKLAQKITNSVIKEQVFPRTGGINLFYLKLYQTQIGLDFCVEDLKVLKKVMGAAENVKSFTGDEIREVPLKDAPILVAEAPQQAGSQAVSTLFASVESLISTNKAPSHSAMGSTRGLIKGAGPKDDFAALVSQISAQLDSVKQEIALFNFLYERNPSEYNYSAMEVWSIVEEKFYILAQLFKAEGLKDFCKVDQMPGHIMLSISLLLKEPKLEWHINEFLKLQNRAEEIRIAICAKNSCIRDSCFTDFDHFDRRIVPYVPKVTQEFINQMTAKLSDPTIQISENTFVYVPGGSEVDAGSYKGEAIGMDPDSHDLLRYTRQRVADITTVRNKKYLPGQAQLNPPFAVHGFPFIVLNPSSDICAKKKEKEQEQALEVFRLHASDEKQMMEQRAFLLNFDPSNYTEAQLTRPLSVLTFSPLTEAEKTHYLAGVIKKMSEAIEAAGLTGAVDFFILLDAKGALKLIFHFTLSRNNLFSDIEKATADIKKKFKTFFSDYCADHIPGAYSAIDQYQKKLPFRSHLTNDLEVPTRISVTLNSPLSSMNERIICYLMSQDLSQEDQEIIQQLGGVTVRKIGAPTSPGYRIDGYHLRSAPKNFVWKARVLFGKKIIDALIENPRFKDVCAAFLNLFSEYNKVRSGEKTPESTVKKMLPSLIGNIISMMKWRCTFAVHSDGPLKPYCVYIDPRHPQQDELKLITEDPLVLALHENPLTRSNLIRRFKTIETLIKNKTFKSPTNERQVSADRDIKLLEIKICKMRDSLEKDKKNLTTICLEWMQNQETAEILRDTVFPDTKEGFMMKYCAEFFHVCISSDADAGAILPPAFNGIVKDGNEEANKKMLLALYEQVVQFMAEIVIPDVPHGKYSQYISVVVNPDGTTFESASVKFTNPTPKEKRVRLFSGLKVEDTARARLTGPQ